MAASSLSRLRIMELDKDFQVCRKYIFMLEKLCPAHYDYKRTVEYKNYKVTERRMWNVWKKRRCI